MKIPVRVVVLLWLGASTAGCSPSPAARISPHLGRVARILVVVESDPTSLEQEWLEDVKLLRCVEEDEQEHLLVELTGYEVSPRDGRSLRLPIALERVIAIEIDGERVYQRR